MRFDTAADSGVCLTTSVLVSLACGLVTLFLCTKLWRRYFENTRDSSSSLPLPPGSFGWPLIGETVQYLLAGITESANKRRRYGTLYKSHVLGSPTARVASDQLVALLVGKEPHSLSSSLPKSAQTVLGKDSLICCAGEQHAAMKRNLRQAFAPVRLSDYLPTVQHCIRRHVISWTQSSDESEMLGFKACQDLVCDLILETVVGCTRDQDPDGRVRDAFVTCHNNLFCIPLDIPGMGFYKAKKARQVLVDFIKTRLASANPSGQDYVSILDVLLTHHHRAHTSADDPDSLHRTGVASITEPAQVKHLSDDQLIDNAVTLLIAGSDTVASALCSILKLLGQHPEKLSALRKELESADLLDTNRHSDLSIELIQSLPYLRAVNKEVLRVLPPVGGLVRRSKKTVEFDDYQIPVDWQVIYSVRDIHQENNAFSDKDKFLPERWLNDALEKKLRTEFPCSYMPFGVGSRLCLGKELAQLEMNVFAVEVSRLAQWKVLNPDAKRVFLPVEKPVDNLPVIISKSKYFQ